MGKWQTNLLCMWKEYHMIDIKRLEPPYEDYGVSKKGDVYSFKFGRRKLSLTKRNEYLAVTLRSDGKEKTKYVHCLVLETFIGPRASGMWCRHLDGDSSNNNLENLCWGTYNENYQDRIKRGTSNRGERNNSAKLTEKDVVKIKKLIGSVSQKDIGKMFSITQSAVSRIKNNHDWAWL